ncbi:MULTISPECIES: type II toxin-antitoxin system RelE/ParE family toxin [Pasteurellaceae]|uniref:Toxin n=2 Tax=Rodentibacter TaxID=1960084 RepID=A0A1V3JLW3_9PAST|nr:MULTISPECIES: type II toxin-antitoxin system RelE/ParE family toxin [Rodentibacter]MBF0750887.1 type II toxin-antitoxin system RelE/ParE family toxin [Pasteurella sp. 19428wF3_WM03]OOF38204.1 toxin [Rodentibacter mrazii]OOF57648.1 toxin [Rodentibacter genomosp. 2]TFU53151.1 toxin [Pasteurella sp. WM03]
MNLTFVELTPFSKYRAEYISDDEYRVFQNELLESPEKGDLIQGLGGLRKVRIADSTRNKGKRGGARVIYYYQDNKANIYLITAYQKSEMDDLSNEQRKALRAVVEEIKKQ